ncbi:hypothetical protein BC567DRAFT_238880 [Phyllosticta citribraziliensis]
MWQRSITASGHLRGLDEAWTRLSFYLTVRLWSIRFVRSRDLNQEVFMAWEGVD